MLHVGRGFGALFFQTVGVLCWGLPSLALSGSLWPSLSPSRPLALLPSRPLAHAPALAHAPRPTPSRLLPLPAPLRGRARLVSMDGEDVRDAFATSYPDYEVLHPVGHGGHGLVL